jgi:hypothetical protein
MATATAAAQPDQSVFRLAGPHNEPAIDDDLDESELDEDDLDDDFDDFDDEDDDEVDFEDEELDDLDDPEMEEV